MVRLVGTPFRELERASLVVTPEERRRFDAALKVEEDRLRAAERAYSQSTARGSHTAPPQAMGHVAGVDSL